MSRDIDKEESLINKDVAIPSLQHHLPKIRPPRPDCRKTTVILEDEDLEKENKPDPDLAPSTYVKKKSVDRVLQLFLNKF